MNLLSCRSARFRRRKAAGRRGIGLLDTLIVVSILAIFSAVAVPQLNESVSDAEEAVLMQNLKTLRSQIEVFKLNHFGNAPGWNSVHPWLHLSLHSDTEGRLSTTPSPLYPHGPYAQQETLKNPFNGGTAVKLSPAPANETPDHALTELGQRVGWFYNPQTGQIAPNAEGNTSSGFARVRL